MKPRPAARSLAAALLLNTLLLPGLLLPGLLLPGLLLPGLLLPGLLLPGSLAAASQSVPASHTQHNMPVDADGAITWEALSDLDIRVETPAPLQTVFHIEFPAALKALDGETVRLKGFMYPLEAGETHSKFLLSALPPACPFCLPGSARTLIDIHCETPVVYTLEPVMLEGRFALLENDDTGLYYRLTEATAVE